MTGKHFDTGNTGLAAEIMRLERETATTETIGPPLADRQTAAMRALDDDAAFFARRVFQPTGYLPGEREHFQLKMLRGALVTIAPDKIRSAERTRIEQQFAANGGIGLSEAEKARRLAELHAQLRIVRAKQEMARREQEGAGELVERPDCDGEMFLRTAGDLESIANGRKAA